MLKCTNFSTKNEGYLVFECHHLGDGIQKRHNQAAHKRSCAWDALKIILDSMSIQDD
ncbi:hypothetical protein WSO01_05910 [Weissella soli]|nr:hypothetical protein WSO01_05910 [Weissella soli]